MFPLTPLQSWAFLVLLCAALVCLFLMLQDLAAWGRRHGFGATDRREDQTPIAPTAQDVLDEPYDHETRGL